MQTTWTRRDVLRGIAAGATALASAASSIRRAHGREISQGSLRKLSIGLVADVHQDVVYDGFERMLFFMDVMRQRAPDMLLQLGDFAVPIKQNQPFLDVWNSFDGPRYHVLGNHDMDHGTPATDRGKSKREVMEWWGMPDRYYSFDKHGWHFVVLDGNKAGAPWVGEIDAGQQAWLADDLRNTTAPTLVFSHQSLERERSGVTNGGAVRAILEEANRCSDGPEVFACLSGHHHSDYARKINGIHYVQINSMSYQLGGAGPTRFAQHIEQTYPRLRLVAPYRDPLFTVLTLDPEQGTFTVEGCETTVIPPDQPSPPTNQELTAAAISARQLRIL